MDISKLTHGAKLVLGGTILFLIVSFFNWFEVTPVIGVVASMWHGSAVLAGLLAIAIIVWEADPPRQHEDRDRLDAGDGDGAVLAILLVSSPSSASSASLVAISSSNDVTARSGPGSGWCSRSSVVVGAWREHEGRRASRSPRWARR